MVEWPTVGVLGLE